MTVSIRDIQRATSYYFDLPIEELTGPRKHREVNIPRQVAYTAAKQLTSQPLTEIGRQFGGAGSLNGLQGASQPQRARKCCRRRRPAGGQAYLCKVCFTARVRISCCGQVHAHRYTHIHGPPMTELEYAQRLLLASHKERKATKNRDKIPGTAGGVPSLPRQREGNTKTGHPGKEALEARRAKVLQVVLADRHIGPTRLAQVMGITKNQAAADLRALRDRGDL